MDGRCGAGARCQLLRGGADQHAVPHPLVLVRGAL